jgi:methionine-rich copper-binding protein CopC
MRLAQMDLTPVNISFFKTLGYRAALVSRVITLVMASAVLVRLDVTAAFAHAQLVRAEPPPGSVLAAAPTEIKLNFNEKLEPAFSSVVVRDAVGARVDQGDAYVDKYRAAMRVFLQPLAQGVYIVEWRAVSVSTHKTEGAFIFRVGE